MSRLVAARALLFAVLAAVLVLVSPAAAHASSPARAGYSSPQDVWRWVYYGLSYPDTAAGLAACTAKGESLIAPPIHSYACEFGTAVAGEYNLWVLYHIITD
jgi:hypothetical protein